MVLNMFDSDVSHMISGVNVDRPLNAISLTSSFRTDLETSRFSSNLFLARSIPTELIRSSPRASYQHSLLLAHSISLATGR